MISQIILDYSLAVSVLLLAFVLTSVMLRLKKMECRTEKLKNSVVRLDKILKDISEKL